MPTGHRLRQYRQAAAGGDDNGRTRIKLRFQLVNGNRRRRHISEPYDAIAGNPFAATSSNTFTIESVAPTFTATPTGAGQAQSVDVTIDFNEAIDLSTVLAAAGTGTLDTVVIEIAGDLSGTGLER